MFYKLYEFTFERKGEPVPAGRHLRLFEQARGASDDGTFTLYRGQKNAVLMHVRAHGDLFMGLVGKHSTEREVTQYDASSDEAVSKTVRDNDYPNAPFICYPALAMIACVDSGQITARSAMARLHAILAHRVRALFVVSPIRQIDDLRFAVAHFKVTEVDYEIRPVNPHTGDLGRQLDENRMRDHIGRLLGKAIGSASNPLQLQGGHLTSVQELQASGHSRVGYTGITDDGVEIKVPKPTEPRPMSEDEPEGEITDETPEVRINFREEAVDYPFSPSHIRKMANIMRTFKRAQGRQDS